MNENEDFVEIEQNPEIQKITISKIKQNGIEYTAEYNGKGITIPIPIYKDDKYEIVNFLIPKELIKEAVND